MYDDLSDSLAAMSTPLSGSSQSCAKEFPPETGAEFLKIPRIAQFQAIEIIPSLLVQNYIAIHLTTRKAQDVGIPNLCQQARQEIKN